MVNVELGNSKLWKRGCGIVQSIAGCSESEAESALSKSKSVRIAVVMICRKCDVQEARVLLDSGKKLRDLINR
jgi:N-acetylmuramic acid 6-phosphate (MurNAc-6-P) etherase